MVKFYISEKCITLGQTQISISYGKGDLVALGAKMAQTLVVKTPKGKELSLVRGDTHACWKSHQSAPADFELLWEALSKVPGQAVELELVSVSEPSPRGKGRALSTVVLDF